MFLSLKIAPSGAIFIIKILLKFSVYCFFLTKKTINGILFRKLTVSVIVESERKEIIMTMKGKILRSITLISTLALCFGSVVSAAEPAQEESIVIEIPQEEFLKGNVFGTLMQLAPYNVSDTYAKTTTLQHENTETLNSDMFTYIIGSYYGGMTEFIAPYWQIPDTYEKPIVFAHLYLATQEKVDNVFYYYINGNAYTLRLSSAELNYFGLGSKPIPDANSHYALLGSGAGAFTLDNALYTKCYDVWLKVTPVDGELSLQDIQDLTDSVTLYCYTADQIQAAPYYYAPFIYQ